MRGFLFPVVGALVCLALCAAPAAPALVLLVERGDDASQRLDGHAVARILSVGRQRAGARRGRFPAQRRQHAVNPRIAVNFNSPGTSSRPGDGSLVAYRQLSDLNSFDQRVEARGRRLVTRHRCAPAAPGRGADHGLVGLVTVLRAGGFAARRRRSGPRLRSRAAPRSRRNTAFSGWTSIRIRCSASSCSAGQPGRIGHRPLRGDPAAELVGTTTCARDRRRRLAVPRRTPRGVEFQPRNRCGVRQRGLRASLQRARDAALGPALAGLNQRSAPARWMWSTAGRSCPPGFAGTSQNEEFTVRLLAPSPAGSTRSGVACGATGVGRERSHAGVVLVRRQRGLRSGLMRMEGFVDLTHQTLERPGAGWNAPGWVCKSSPPNR
jgi:hypothetical protein